MHARPFRASSFGVCVVCLYMCVHESFNIMILDHEFWDLPKQVRDQRSPSFETFFIACPSGGKVASGGMLQWCRTAGASWQNRGTWLHTSADVFSDATRSAMLLRASEWHGLHNIEALFPPSVSGGPRRQRRQSVRKEGIHPVLGRERPDTLLPWRVPQFLADCSVRPLNFESLCQSLYSWNKATQQGLQYSSPLWFQAGRPLKAVECPRFHDISDFRGSCHQRTNDINRYEHHRLRSK